ncbi:ArfGap-domain-containing protein [Phlegmacium glaucopus]|nr:ArfGap-domain-containing protein [Phlegmacium glaucopus]
MSRQDKATTEKFAKTLRELVKQQDNKVCADCKRNDPRWASWNLGVFLCIRCSGIHRGMGTHISKVKSVDLDVWTPEQMASIQKWGNRLANLYWEAHLKPGHVPPEHKMESFIRSKYESRRWALDGPPPVDPFLLDNGAPSAPPPQQQASPPPRPTHTQSTSISTPITTRQPQAHQLLSSNYTNRSAATPNSPAVQPPAPAPPQVQPSPANDLFSLDFHAPAVPVNNTPAPEQKKDVKQNILSLFSAPPPAPAHLSGQFPQIGNQTAYWGGAALPQQQQQHQPTGMMGMNGTAMWGAASGWSAPVIPAQANVWGSPAPQQQSNPFNSTADWNFTATPTPAVPDLFSTTPAAQKKDDEFGDIWGGFK